MTLSINDTQHNNALRYAECRYAKCRVLFTFMLSVNMLNVIMQSVVMLSVMAPQKIIGPIFFLQNFVAENFRRRENRFRQKVQNINQEKVENSIY